MNKKRKTGGGKSERGGICRVARLVKNEGKLEVANLSMTSLL
jgi:hypothetical protein